ncbi:hypothetical protein BGZ74_009890 [Mortierella antarctica]|nr:hypothetical protein BGZ74_009890 [Mortierella antarctica]
MSSARADSRTNSVYVDAPEIASEDEASSLSTPMHQEPLSHSTTTETSATTTETGLHNSRSSREPSAAPVTPIPQEEEEDEEDDGDEEDDEDEAEYLDNSGSEGSRGRSRDRDEDIQEDGDDDEEIIVMQADSTTGLQRAVSQTRSSSAASISSHMRRQQRRMASANRVSSVRSGASGGGTSSGASTGGSSSSNPRTSVAPVVDERAQSELRRKIMDIQRDPTISFADKAGMIQKLMSSKWQDSGKAVESKGSEETSEEDLKTTYSNKEQGHLGCKHYRRGCKLKANCCGKWFNCRFCHDDACDHAIVRSETKEMLCMHCKTIQPAAQECSSCKATLAKYYCDICKLWDDDPRKQIYHCDDCGICRIGKGLGEDFFHCKKCNICMSTRLLNHKCIERNLECDCPICGEYMFTSTATVIFMPCGHCIHSRCHDDYIKTSYQCPTCWKALGDMSTYYTKIDSLLKEQTMPPEYANIFSTVLCNDCEVKSEAPYHFLYHKCDKCKGYNTKVLETFRRAPADGSGLEKNATAAAGAVGTGPEDNTSGGGGASGSGTHGLYASGDRFDATNSTAATSTSTSTATTTSVIPIDIIHVPVPRSPLLDGNASGDMTVSGMSGNSAP